MTEVHGLTCCWWMPHEGGAYALPSDLAGKFHDEGTLPVFLGTYAEACEIVRVATPAPAPIPTSDSADRPLGADEAASDKPSPAKRGRRKGVVEFVGAMT